MQAVARCLFAERTVLTIAHRLDTVIECDTVVVMEAGKVAETGPVCELLQVRRGRRQRFVAAILLKYSLLPRCQRPDCWTRAAYMRATKS